MIRLLAIMILLSLAPKCPAGVRLPSAAEEVAAASWSALATSINSALAVTNPPGHTDGGGYRYLLRLNSGFLGCAISSNQIAYANHVGIPTACQYEGVFPNGQTFFTDQATHQVGGNPGIGIVTITGAVFSVYAPVQTNRQSAGTEFLSWGRGLGLDPGGTPTGAAGVRQFPIGGGGAQATRYNKFTLSFAGTFYNFYSTIGTNTDGVTTGGDSSGPCFVFNNATGRYEFVSVWWGSDAGTTPAGAVQENNLQQAYGTYSATGLIVSLLGTDLFGSATNAVATATPGFGTAVFERLSIGGGP